MGTLRKQALPFIIHTEKFSSEFNPENFAPLNYAERKFAQSVVGREITNNAG